MVEQVRKLIVEVFGDYIGDNPIEETEKNTYLGEDDPGQWAPKAAVVIHTEMFLPSNHETGIIDKWNREISAKLDGYYVEFINDAVAAVYKL